MGDEGTQQGSGPESESGQPWRRSTRIWITVAGVLGAALMILLGVWLWATLVGIQDEVAAVDERVTDLESQMEAASAAIDESPGETSTVEGDADSDEASDQGSSDDADSSSAASAGDREMVFIEEADWLEEPVLTVDYVQFLSGAEAAEAAEAQGDESPPPNDYYILNENAKLRTFSVNRDATVVLVTGRDGSSDPDGYEVSFGEFYDGLLGEAGAVPGMWSVPYWITIEDGRITAIEQQYLP